jgi:hypothetical protein
MMLRFNVTYTVNRLPTPFTDVIQASSWESVWEATRIYVSELPLLVDRQPAVLDRIILVLPVR